jgi:hypothetical protein
VIGQFLRQQWWGALCEVGWRANNGHAHVRPDPHRDHVLRHLLAKAHAGIVALRNDVDQLIVCVDLYLDVRIFGQQFRQLRQKNRIGRVIGCRDANGASRLVAQRAQGRQFGLDLFQARRHGQQKTFSRLGR